MFSQQIATLFKSKGFDIIEHTGRDEQQTLEISDILYMKYKSPLSIYGSEGRSSKNEFLVVSKTRNLRIFIKCLWQQTRGTADKKLPFFYLNILETNPEKEIIIVIDGDGWVKGSKEWLANAAKKKLYSSQSSRSKRIKVMNLKEFITWANDTIR